MATNPARERYALHSLTGETKIVGRKKAHEAWLSEAAKAARTHGPSAFMPSVPVPYCSVYLVRLNRVVASWDSKSGWAPSSMERAASAIGIGVEEVWRRI